MNKFTKCMNGYDLSTFEKFIHLAQRKVNGNKYGEHKFFDHFRPQIEYMQEGVEIYKFETLGKMVSELKQKVGVTRNLTIINSTSKGEKYQDYYTPETKQIVEELYSSDISFFNYSY